MGWALSVVGELFQHLTSSELELVLTIMVREQEMSS